MKYDLAIIGGGPGGYSAAFKAAEEGLNVVMFEKDKLGGTCLNRGCVPTKALLHSAELYSTLKNSEKYGISASEVSYQMSAIVQRKNEIVEKLRNDLQKAVKANKVTLVEGCGQLAGEHRVICNSEEYEADNIIIATGSKVAIPPIPGIDSSKVITSNELLEREDIDYDSLIIIGAGVIGIECASIYLSLGKPVTLVEMADRILPTMDPEIAQRLNMFLKKRGAVIHTSARVTAINDDTVVFTDKKGQECQVSGQAILVATGRRSNLDGLLAEGVQLEINRGIFADEDGRTSLPGVYVIGDARSGNIQLAHLAMAQGENVVDTIMGREKAIDEKVVPSCLYTQPEAASVGLYEQQAKEMGLNIHSRKSLTGANGKCCIEDSASGYVKLVLDENEVIIGAQLVCPHATEMIGELALAVKNGYTADQLAEVIHPHPTIMEMIAAAAK